jgi:uncharacterized protein (DUF1810 family)
MPDTDDPFDLQRFVDAQAPVYDRVLLELRAGRKRSHWMWFIFPQLAGLGSSSMAQRYALASRAEARSYFEHELLRQRLCECTQLVLAAETEDVHDILGYPDDLKFRSSMTLFAEAVPEEPLFQQALDKFFSGQRDPRTLRALDPQRQAQ